MKISAIIPCRYGSSRFPGKPLATICGKPMLCYPYEAAIKSNIFEEVAIATDSELIASECHQRGIKVIFTEKNHLTGSDRVAEAAKKLQKSWDMLVNIQGDEPFIRISDLINLVNFGKLKSGAINAYSKISNISEITNHGVVKVELSKGGKIIGLSRSQIPYINNKACELDYFRQTGLYLFRKNDLEVFEKTQQSRLEIAEGIEMLRLIENDRDIFGFEIPGGGIAVDTISDLEIAEAEMRRLSND